MVLIQTTTPIYDLAALAQSPKPIIVFVPDSWHNANCFHLVIDLLEDAGYNSVLIHNPSFRATAPSTADTDAENENVPAPGAPTGTQATPKPPVPVNAQTDVASIQSILDKILPFNDVLIIVHGHGAIPTCEALRGYAPSSTTHAHAVQHILFASAFLPVQGQSIRSAYGSTHNLPVLNPTSAQSADLFFNDLTPYAANIWAGKLRPYESETLDIVCSYSAWREIASTYLFTTRDNAIPVDVQRDMVERAERQSGVVFGKLDVEAGHNPFLSVPYQVLGAVKRAAGEA